MTMLTDRNIISDQFQIKAGLMAHNNDLNAFIRDDDCEASYWYLENKLKKHMEAGNIERVVVYYRLMIHKDYRKAPSSSVELIKEVKEYLRKVLML
jgi:hypothetical protein